MAFSDSSIAPIRTTCSIMKLFSFSLCYASATDGAIAIKSHSYLDVSLVLRSGSETHSDCGFESDLDLELDSGGCVAAAAAVGGG